MESAGSHWWWWGCGSFSDICNSYCSGLSPPHTHLVLMGHLRLVTGLALFGLCTKPPSLHSARSPLPQAGRANVLRQCLSKGAPRAAALGCGAGAAAGGLPGVWVPEQGWTPKHQFAGLSNAGEHWPGCWLPPTVAQRRGGCCQPSPTPGDRALPGLARVLSLSSFNTTCLR